jgi:hypothetical protein
MLGRRERFDAVPFFWSQHYDVSMSMSVMPSDGTVQIDGALDQGTGGSPIRKKAGGSRSQPFRGIARASAVDSALRGRE